MGNVVRSQMNTEKAPKVTQPTAKSVVIPKLELAPPLELPLSVPCDPLGLGLIEPV